jgi:hypothetical protein
MANIKQLIKIADTVRLLPVSDNKSFVVTYSTKGLKYSGITVLLTLSKYPKNRAHLIATVQRLIISNKIKLKQND